MSATIDHILAELDIPELDLQQTRESLELGALLGPSVDLAEWRCACQLQGLETSDAFASNLAACGVIELDERSWTFSDDALREQLLAAIEAAGRARARHSACAQALFVLYSERRSGVAARRADHLCRAGRLEEALRPLLHATKEVYDSGDFDAVREYLDLHEELLDEIGAADDDPRRAQNRWRRAKLHHVVGETERAKTLLTTSRAVLDHTDMPSERGHAALLHGRLLRDEGLFDAARHCFDEAVAQFGLAGDNHGLAISRASRGYVELQTGDYTRARQSFGRALNTFEAIDDRFMVASMLSIIGQTWLFDDQQDEALAAIEQALEVARQAGHKPNEAAALLGLGEVGRKRRDWAEARRRYSAAAKLYEEIDNRSLYITRFNLALTEIGAGNFSAARELLEELASDYSRVGMRARLPLVHVGLMVCAAEEADWDGFERQYTTSAEMIEQYDLAHDDIVWMAREAIELARRHGHREAGLKAGELACLQLERLGRSEEAEELRDQLASEGAY